MKKIIIIDSIKSLLDSEQSVLNRASLKILTARSNEEALDLHRSEKADLIIVNFSTGGMSGEKFCSLVRDDETLRAVSIIMICQDPEIHPEELTRCRANSFITAPVSPDFLIEKAHHLLNIPKRETYRAPISIKVEGETKGRPFLCHAENLSSAGMLFITDKELEKGERLLCSFHIPDSVRIRAEAEVVRVVRRYLDADITEYGIRFSKIKKEFREAIEEYVERIRKQER